MAAILLLPGQGGKYTSETFSAISLNSVGADTIDMSRCSAFSVQLSSTTSNPAVQLQWSHDLTNWVNLGSIVTSGTLFDLTDGPFGAIRIGSATTAVTAFTVSIIGYPINTKP